jgi:hypothetical protein
MPGMEIPPIAPLCHLLFKNLKCAMRRRFRPLVNESPAVPVEWRFPKRHESQRRLEAACAGHGSLEEATPAHPPCLTKHQGLRPQPSRLRISLASTVTDRRFILLPDFP